MSKSKWFVVRKPSTGEMIALSANQIVPPKFCGGTKMLYYIHQTPLSSWSVEGVLGTRLQVLPPDLQKLKVVIQFPKMTSTCSHM